jgi:hypothetical protein
MSTIMSQADKRRESGSKLWFTEIVHLAIKGWQFSRFLPMGKSAERSGCVMHHRKGLVDVVDKAGGIVEWILLVKSPWNIKPSITHA